MDIANITVVGNALNTPEWRRFERTNALVAHFKIASTARRFDKVNGRWIDGDNLRVRVNCWRRLAEGVVASVRVGDPVVVTGRMYTRDWTTEDGQRRSTYELEAVTVGHDLGRGVAAFKRGRINVNTTVVEDAETDKHVQGEPTSAAPEANARSEALAAGLGAELRATIARGDGPGYDAPVNAERVALEDLSATIASEMRGSVDALIAEAQRKLGPTAPDRGEQQPDDDGETSFDEAAHLSEAPTGPSGNGAAGTGAAGNGAARGAALGTAGNGAASGMAGNGAASGMAGNGAAPGTAGNGATRGAAPGAADDAADVPAEPAKPRRNRTRVGASA